MSIRNGSYKVTPEQLETIRIMVGKGCSDIEIGKAIGKCRRAVYHHRRKHGIKSVRRVHRAPQDRIRAIHEQILLGLTFRQVSERLGLTKSTVSGIVWRYGLRDHKQLQERYLTTYGQKTIRREWAIKSAAGRSPRRNARPVASLPCAGGAVSPPGSVAPLQWLKRSADHLL